MIRVAIPVLALLMAASGSVAADEPPALPAYWTGSSDLQGFQAGVDRELEASARAVARLVAVRGPRTIDNTLAPLDEAFDHSDSAIARAALAQAVHPDAAFRDRATAAYEKANAARTALTLDTRVYRALARLDIRKADPATRHYVARTLLQFRLSGVSRSAADRARLQTLNDALTKATAEFERNIADGQLTVEVADPSELEGLPQDYIDRHPPDAKGRIAITTAYPDAFPVFKFAKKASLRERVYVAFANRAYPKNRPVLAEMLRLRHEIATLLGYPSWADYNAADKMMGNGRNIAAFIDELDAAARPVAEREFAMLLEEYRKTHAGATAIPVTDRSYMKEQLRRSQFAFDSQSVRPYLPYERVKAGLMATAARLYQVEFREARDVPVWDPSVETWDVIDRGRRIGRFYLDMHPRPGKFSHAEAMGLVNGIEGKQLPEAALICNFPTPTATDPGLMEYRDVESFLHEFGHLMHNILGGHQRWAGISGIKMEWDFVEAPSQMLEEWMRSPQVLTSFARHYQTGEVIPLELIERMNRAAAFGRGLFLEEQLGFAQESYEYYRGLPERIDLDAVQRAAETRFSAFAPIEQDHSYAAFGHLSGYSSAYYTYMFDLVIATDFFSQFDQKDLLAGDAPERYRRTVLEPGGSVPAAELVRAFLGRAQNTKAIRAWMGQEFSTPAAH